MPHEREVAMQGKLKIGELAKRTGFSTKAIRYYELVGLLEEPARSESGYRLYAESDAERLDFIEKAKRLGFSLEEIRDILLLSEQQERPCVHVLALIDQKLERVDDVLRDLRTFRRELAKLRKESAEQIERLPADASVCGIVVTRPISIPASMSSSLLGNDASNWLMLAAAASSRPPTKSWNIAIMTRRLVCGNRVCAVASQRSVLPSSPRKISEYETW